MILYMCMLQFLYASFEGSLGREEDKIGIFLKKSYVP
jgi:hypothetical protein